MTRYAPRHRPKRDKSEPAVVEALQAAGCTVWRKLPCDLLVWVPGAGIRTAEAKTPKGGKLKLRKDQQEQAEFCATTGTPYLTSAGEAIDWLNRLRHGER